MKKVLGFLLLCLPLMVPATTGVLGRLGQALSTSTIYASASSKARQYYKVKQYEYLIVREMTGTWTKVIMENGRYGYIQDSKVAVLPYNVTTDKVARQPSRSASSASGRALAAQYSLDYIGTPYVWGGNDLKNGIDCSGFVKKLYGQIGLDLPRTAAEQAKVGQKIERLEDLKAGDRLYFWDKKRGKIGHTGIYLGNGFFCHSSVNNRGVATDDLRNPKWRGMLVAARR